MKHCFLLDNSSIFSRQTLTRGTYFLLHLLETPRLRSTILKGDSSFLSYFFGKEAATPSFYPGADTVWKRLYTWLQRCIGGKDASNCNNRFQIFKRRDTFMAYVQAYNGPKCRPSRLGPTKPRTHSYFLRKKEASTQISSGSRCVTLSDRIVT